MAFLHYLYSLFKCIPVQTRLFAPPALGNREKQWLQQPFLVGQMDCQKFLPLFYDVEIQGKEKKGFPKNMFLTLKLSS